MRVEGATHRAADGRGVMKRFELLSIIGSIVAAGIALGAVVIGSNANLHAELRTEMQSLRTETRTGMQNLRRELHAEIAGMRADITADITDVRNDIRALETRLAAVERRQARTEGLLEGLRDAITAQGRQDPPAKKEST